MAGNGTFQHKSITQHRKTFITQQNIWYFVKIKGFESLGSGFVISEKKIVFCFGRGPWGPQFCTSWAEKQ